MPTAIRAEDHIDWAATIAATIARDYRLAGQEADDLKQAAILKVVELVAGGRFDPDRVQYGDVLLAWRGWAYPWVRCEAIREAVRIRGGGLFHTIRPANLVTADPLGDAAESVPVEPDYADPDGVSGGRVIEVKATVAGRSFRWPKKRGT